MLLFCIFLQRVAIEMQAGLRELELIHWRYKIKPKILEEELTVQIITKEDGEDQI